MVTGAARAGQSRQPVRMVTARFLGLQARAFSAFCSTVRRGGAAGVTKMGAGSGS